MESSHSYSTPYLPLPVVAMFPRITVKEKPDVSSLETSSPSLFLSFSPQRIGKSVEARFPFNRHFFFPLVKARACL